ncbi:MAG TPA: DUF2283 domain-containing protein [Candidatus Nanoarchaeia archaeon]|nr:DUF2283 domain-containing protein [Candidatus Nanoarchaeia archaeon]
MKLEYDKEVDAAYIYIKYPIKDGECAKTIELNDNIFIDYSKDGRLLGVEILNAKKILGKKVIETAVPA